MQPVLGPALGNRGLSWNSRHLHLGPASPIASPPGVPFPSRPPGPSQTPRLRMEPPHLPLDTVSCQQPVVCLRSLLSAAACGLLTASSAPLTRCLSLLEFSAILNFFLPDKRKHSHLVSSPTVCPGAGQGGRLASSAGTEVAPQAPRERTWQTLLSERWGGGALRFHSGRA